MNKQAEGSFVKVAKRYGWGWHKYGDVRYCIHCHQPLPKTERAPDYLLAPVFTWVECKNNDATGRWDWKNDIGPEGNRKNQREWLKEHNGWLFIELGQGRAPNDRGAFLIPWLDWERLEASLLEQKQYSLRYRGLRGRLGADMMLMQYKLEWNKGWYIPGHHIFWFALHSKLREATIAVEKITGQGHYDE